MFDVIDLLIVVILCGIIIFSSFYLKHGQNIKIEENISPENDILHFFYDESSYKIEISAAKTENAKMETHIELGITSVVDDGGCSDNEDESDGFFMYQPNESEEEADEGDEDVPAPPRTWEDFMKDATEQSPEPETPETLFAHLKEKEGKDRTQSLKDVLARVRGDIVEKPLSDEDFKKKYFSRLYDEK